MNIVVLDGGGTNPGDLSWSPLEQLGILTVYPDSRPEEIVSRAEQADIVVMCRTPMTASIIQKLPRLKMIAALATGYNTIDLEAAGERRIVVSNVPFYCVETVAQSVFALLLALCNHVHTYSREVQNGNWTAAVDMNHTTHPFYELAGKTIGIFGYGNIGQKVAQIASAFGMQICISSRTKKPCPFPHQWTDTETLFRVSDVVSIHCPLTGQTRGIVNAGILNTMKPASFLINTSRGAVINEQHLADALNRGVIAGAGLDVLALEPPETSNPLLRAKNCFITPHIGWASKESRTRLIQTVAENIACFLEGRPQNIVN